MLPPNRLKGKESYRYKIGIDPGIKSGWASWDCIDKEFKVVKTMKLWEIFRALGSPFHFDDTMVYIENPNTFIPFKNVPREEIDARKQGAGACKQTFKHIIEFLEDHNIPYQTTRLQGGLKKKSAQWFREQTKWEERTDEHGRDAALIVWGR